MLSAMPAYMEAAFPPHGRTGDERHREGAGKAALSASESVPFPERLRAGLGQEASARGRKQRDMVRPCGRLKVRNR